MNKAIAWALIVAVPALLALGQTMSPQTDENRRVSSKNSDVSIPKNRRLSSIRTPKR
jgi:hypothetical protein